MAKGTWESPPKRDDPIFKEGLTVFTPRSARGSTPSSPKSTGSKPSRASKAETRPAPSKPTSVKVE